MSNQETTQASACSLNAEAGIADPNFCRAALAEVQRGSNFVTKIIKNTSQKLKNIWEQWEQASMRHLTQDQKIAKFKEAQHRRHYYMIHGLF